MHLARPRLTPLALVPLLFFGCRRPASTPDGAWRDQFIFVSDDGTVLSLGVHRQSGGRAEAKLWHGAGDSWKAVLYRQFTVSRERAPRLSASLEKLSGAPVRVELSREGRALRIELRTPDRSVGIIAKEMAELGTTRDPEGTSRYRAGRVWAQDNNNQLGGWLIAEETPPSRPRAAFIDYQDFVFVVVASKDGGVLVAKRSRGLRAFNHAYTLRGRRAEHTREVAIEVGPAEVEVRLADLERSARYRIAARDASRGVGPKGRALVYETLLLRDTASGVAFVIRPEREGDR